MENRSMSAISCFFLAIKKYAVFGGRASRSEYWFFILFRWLFTLTFIIIARITSIPPLIAFAVIGLFWFLTLLPDCAIRVRRLHDSGRSGWWFYSVIILYIIIFLYSFTIPNEFRSLAEFERWLSLIRPNTFDEESMQAFTQSQPIRFIIVLFCLYSLCSVLHFMIFVFTFLKGHAGENQFGEAPFAHHKVSSKIGSQE